MGKYRLVHVSGLFATVAIVLAACGGGEPTATPPPTPTAAKPAASPTQTPAVPTATSPAVPTATVPAAPTTTPTPAATRAPAPTPTPTQAVAPTPTAAPGTGIPTPVINQGGKRGGTLSTSIRTVYISTFDTFSSGGRGAVPAYNLLLNNLLWTDPYGKGLVGDVAQGWTFSGAGKVITFTLRKGIQFHDGKPLTAKDVAYNLDRAWKPRSTTMLEFQAKLGALENVETPDDLTVKLTLKQPSNYLLQGLSINQFLIYPAHMPLPDFNQQWKQTAIGSGPFKLRQAIAGTRIETLRNESYWKAGLPYLDGVNLHAIDDDALVLASYRTGKLEAANLDFTPLGPAILDGTLQREVGWVRVDVIGSGAALMFTQREPFSDPKVREAIDLAVNRQDVLLLVHFGQGTAFAAPLIPPEKGGQWGIPEAEMKARPGYREDKSQDLARAKALLGEAGVQPSAVTVRILDSVATARRGEVVEQSIRQLGFKTQLVLAVNVELAARPEAFEIILDAVTVQADDPSDYLSLLVQTGAGRNYFKWSDSEVDRLLREQDQELDIGKRRQLLRDLQERILTIRPVVNLGWRTTPIGYNKFIKNFPTNPLFQQGHRFRWEQVWLER